MINPALPPETFPEIAQFHKGACVRARAGFKAKSPVRNIVAAKNVRSIRPPSRVEKFCELAARFLVRRGKVKSRSRHMSRRNLQELDLLNY
jgi:hypothetical protein